MLACVKSLLRFSYLIDSHIPMFDDNSILDLLNCIKKQNVKRYVH